MVTVGTTSGQPHFCVAVSYLRHAGTMQVVQSSPVTVTVGQSGPPVSVGSSPPVVSEGVPVGSVRVEDGGSPVGVSVGGMLTSPVGVSPAGMLKSPSGSCAAAEPALWGLLVESGGPGARGRIETYRARATKVKDLILVVQRVTMEIRKFRQAWVCFWSLPMICPWRKDGLFMYSRVGVVD